MAAGAWAKGGRLMPAALPHAAFAANVPTGALAAVLVVALAEDAGGYYARTWGWATLAACAVAAGALLARRGVPVGRREWAAAAVFAAWLLWVGAESTRVGAATAGVPVVERGVLYLLVFWAALLVVSPRSLEWLVAGLVAGLTIVACIGLRDYLAAAAVPNPFEGRLLFAPVGYANAAGILCGLGALLAVGLAVHARARVLRAAAASALVPLLDAAAFTQSRGTLAALGVGALGLLAVDERRGRVLSTLGVSLPLPLVGIGVASRMHVGDAHAAAAVAQHDGRVLEGILVALTAAAAAAAWRTLAAGGVGRRDRWVGRTGFVSLVVVATAGVAAVVGHGLGDRAAYWRAAVRDVAAHPVLGSGPGSFASAWLRYRDVPRSTLDAHNLYLQTLAEVGPVGLALLVVALAIPLGAVATARRREGRYTAAIAAAYTAALVHSALDWDWQMPAAAAVVLVLAAALLVAARDADAPQRRGAVFTGAAIATAAAVVVAAFVTIGNSRLTSATRAAAASDWPRAGALARSAATWQPWSSDPLLLTGEADAATGDLRGARAAFAEAARRDPSSWRAWYDVALASRDAQRQAALAQLHRLDPLRTG